MPIIYSVILQYATSRLVVYFTSLVHLWFNQFARFSSALNIELLRFTMKKKTLRKLQKIPFFKLELVYSGIMLKLFGRVIICNGCRPYLLVAIKRAGQSVSIPRHSQTRAKSAHLFTFETKMNTPSKNYQTYKCINK